jgi:hypothetical protein
MLEDHYSVQTEAEFLTSLEQALKQNPIHLNWAAKWSNIQDHLSYP